MFPERYTSRFAPSPTGHLHLGSVFTALAGFLDARANQGLWQLRFDDLDTPRNVSGSINSILKTLEILGLHWDNAIDYQSQHIDEYHAILLDLMTQEKIYRCNCSRKDLSPIYTQTCRHKKIPAALPHSLRLKTDSRDIIFEDDLQGRQTQNLAEYGDFILKRKDNIIAYQFAVILDDMRQNVTHIVRGIDLLNETPKQIYLQQLLNLPTPHYLHIPILINSDGKKLSKTTLAAEVVLSKPNQVLFQLLDLLEQKPPCELKNMMVSEILEWAIQNWTISNLKMMKNIDCG